MAIRTDYNPYGLEISFTACDFVKREGRGRPQTNPYVSIDLSAVSDLCGSEGEKRVRNEAFKLLRNMLAIDPKALIVTDPRGTGKWIIKDDSVRADLTVCVTSVNVADDDIFG